jgi:hypothetical protein
VADLDAVAAALDEIAAECGPAQDSFVNPAKTLALELLDALPVIAAEGPLASAAAGRVADQLATLAGLPATGFRLPTAGGRLRVSGARWRRGPDDFFRDRAEDVGRGCGCSPSATRRRPHDGGGGREPRSAQEAMARCCAPRRAATSR